MKQNGSMVNAILHIMFECMVIGIISYGSMGFSSKERNL